MSWRARMVDFLFPPKCPFCRRVTEGQRVCPKCEKALPWTEGKDREQVLSGGLRCASPLWYEDLAREGILRFKFHGGAGAEVLGRCWRTAPRSATAGSSTLSPGCR